MKKRNVFLGLFALSLLILVAACSKEEKASSDELLAQAGELHNQLLKNYYQNRSNTAPEAGEIVQELMDLSSDYMISEGYSSAEVLNASKRVHERYRISSLKGVLEEGFSFNAMDLLGELNEMDLYSEDFKTAVYEVMSMVDEGSDLQLIHSYINGTFASLQFENEKDCEGQELFKNVFNSSHEYWTTEYQKGLKGIKLDDSSKVIINDGIGAILGSPLGPIGSIFFGTLFSVGTNEEIK